MAFDSESAGVDKIEFEIFGKPNWVSHVSILKIIDVCGCNWVGTESGAEV